MGIKQSKPHVTELLDVYEVAKLLKVSRSSVWSWSKSRIIPPPIKVGPKTTRWRIEQLQDYLDGL